jgi:hypothetical protein
MSTIDPDDGVTDAELIAGTAYQIVGNLAYKAGLHEDPEVIRAMNWFSQYKAGDKLAELLPWGWVEPEEEAGKA